MHRGVGRRCETEDGRRKSKMGRGLYRPRYDAAFGGRADGSSIRVWALTRGCRHLPLRRALSGAPPKPGPRLRIPPPRPRALQRPPSDIRRARSSSCCNDALSDSLSPNKPLRHLACVIAGPPPLTMIDRGGSASVCPALITTDFLTQPTCTPLRRPVLTDPAHSPLTTLGGSSDNFSARGSRHPEGVRYGRFEGLKLTSRASAFVSNRLRNATRLIISCVPAIEGSFLGCG